MNFGTERNRQAWEKLTPEQKAAVEKIRVQHRTSEYRAAEARVREEVRNEFPPKGSNAPRGATDLELIEAFARLRAERERLGISLGDIQEETGIDRATISKLERGVLPNPSIGMLRKYAATMGWRLKWSLEYAPQLGVKAMKTARRQGRNVCPPWYKAVIAAATGDYPGGGNEDPTQYITAGAELAKALRRLIGPYDEDEQEAKVGALNDLLDRKDDDAAFDWFTRELPRCANMVPQAHRWRFIDGARRLRCLQGGL